MQRQPIDTPGRLSQQQNPSLRCDGEIVRVGSTRLRTHVMAGLRFAVLFTASSFGVLLLAASASASASRPPAVYGAGDEWRAAPASNDGTHLTLIMWATRHRFYVGDVLGKLRCSKQATASSGSCLCETSF